MHVKSFKDACQHIGLIKINENISYEEKYADQAHSNYTLFTIGDDELENQDEEDVQISPISRE